MISRAPNIARWSARGMRRTWRELRAWQRFARMYRRYRAMAVDSPPAWQSARITLQPCLHDDGPSTPIEPVYYYQDGWAFRRIVCSSPASHVDVGSHHKYVSLLSGVVPVVFVDIRPIELPLPGLTCVAGSLLHLPFPDASVQSLSSLCVVEHIGLGRYGDPLDPWGTEKAIAELKRVLAPGGSLYLSAPIEDQNTLYFNAHRAFTEDYLLSLLHPLSVLERRYIDGTRFTTEFHGGQAIGCYQLLRPR
jgi:SAM-dependent methyltransferase